jgi:ATP/maltotriose-dependent transcriptional regulator MalT
MATKTCVKQFTWVFIFKGAWSKGYEISKKLFISTDTVRTHLRSIYKKLHVCSRTEAVVKYLQGL